MEEAFTALSAPAATDHANTDTEIQCAESRRLLKPMPAISGKAGVFGCTTH